MELYSFALTLVSLCRSIHDRQTLTLLVKDTIAGARRPYDGIGRQGAVRKRKGDVFEMNGHQFVHRQFYQPIMCALCQEFLLTGEGYQCEDCRYACHKKCYPKVVTKCISKAKGDGVGFDPHVRSQAHNTGRRRGEDQPPYPASLHAVHQHVGQLVLPLWLHAAFRAQEFGQVFG